MHQADATILPRNLKIYREVAKDAKMRKVNWVVDIILLRLRHPDPSREMAYSGKWNESA